MWTGTVLETHLLGKWDPKIGPPALEAHGADELNKLLHHFSIFFTPEEKDAARREWARLKEKISKNAWLHTLDVRECYVRLFTQHGLREPLKHILRMAAIMWLLTPDTSESERYFSIMNDIKTATRNRLKHLTLNRLMHWHIHFSKLTAAEFHPYAVRILKVWKAGAKRTTTRPATTPARPAPKWAKTFQ